MIPFRIARYVLPVIFLSVLFNAPKFLELRPNEISMPVAENSTEMEIVAVSVRLKAFYMEQSVDCNV